MGLYEGIMWREGAKERANNRCPRVYKDYELMYVLQDKQSGSLIEKGSKDKYVHYVCTCINTKYEILRS